VSNTAYFRLVAGITVAIEQQSIKEES
jgi:hypothetical protein